MTVNFTDLSTPSNTIAIWNWDFGDGKTSTERNPTHAYEDCGTYTVSLTVTESDGDNATKTRTDYVEVIAIDPIADFSASPLAGDKPLTVDFTDLMAWADYLEQQPYIDRERMGVAGGSYGGYMALAALVDYPDVFGAGIDNVGIANFVTFLKNTKSYRRAIREAEYGPLSDEEFLREISPLTHADRIKAPLLIVHGENDSRVPVGEARQIAEAIEANGGVVETLIFPDEGHGISKINNRLVYYRTMVDFLDEHLKD